MLQQRFIQPIEKMSATARFVAALLLVGLIAAIDALTGAILALSVFYLVPVALATVPDRFWLGYAVAVVAAAASVAGDIAQDPARAPIYVLNGAFRLALFVIVVTLLHRLQGSIARERELARTDPLTGLPNRRQFEEVAERELLRSRRSGREVTLAYVDLDGFKTVNDQRGHAAGDEVLRLTATTLAANVRNSDVVARLGGDEFAVLLVDSLDHSSDATLARVRDALHTALGAWQVSATIGTARVSGDAGSVEELMKAADRQMYEEKRRREPAGVIVGVE